MSNPLSGLFSPATRKTLYTVYSLAVVAVGAVTVWCASTAAAQPSWVDGSTAVLAYIGGGLGLTAASNVPTPDTDEAGGDGGWTTSEVCLAVLAACAVLLLLRAFGTIG